jgi:tRNA dimethylallyltransferase
MYINAVTAGYDFRSKNALSESREPNTRPGFPQKPYFIGTLVSREVRNARIDRRLDERLKEGMIEEIDSLIKKGVSPEKLISYGLEYKFITLYLIGELSLEEAREKLAIAIHQFAKRQMTWFRGMERSGVRIHWVEV